jgi:hypothetical protein
MPDVSVVTPAAVVSADRLSLGLSDARGLASAAIVPCCAICQPGVACMAEE